MAPPALKNISLDAISSYETWLIPRMMIPLPTNIIIYTGEFISI
jgi:hypothetical protein